MTESHQLNSVCKPQGKKVQTDDISSYQCSCKAKETLLFVILR